LETHAPWSPVVPDLQIEKLNLQRYQSKQQTKIRMGGSDVAKAGSIRKRNSDLDTQDEILVHLRSSFCQHNNGKCRHLGTCCVVNY
jgi:hypothetical protein